MPDVVVEVILPNDLAEELFEKLDDYQSAGIPLIWVVNPVSRAVWPFPLNGSEPSASRG